MKFLISEGWRLQVGAGVAALNAAGLLSWTERRFAGVQEVLIGSLYMVAGCGAIRLLAHNPHGGEHLTELLAGQILWVSYGRVWPVALLSAVVLVAWWGSARRKPVLFYPFVAVAASVYLVFATLILPGLAVRRMSEWQGLAAAYALGAIGYALGLWLSAPLDLPSGPLVELTLGGLFAGYTCNTEDVVSPPFGQFVTRTSESCQEFSTTSNRRFSRRPSKGDRFNSRLIRSRRLLRGLFQSSRLEGSRPARRSVDERG